MSFYILSWDYDDVSNTVQWGFQVLQVLYKEVKGVTNRLNHLKSLAKNYTMHSKFTSVNNTEKKHYFQQRKLENIWVKM